MRIKRKDIFTVDFINGIHTEFKPKPDKVDLISDFMYSREYHRKSPKLRNNFILRDDLLQRVVASESINGPKIFETVGGRFSLASNIHPDLRGDSCTINCEVALFTLREERRILEFSHFEYALGYSRARTSVRINFDNSISISGVDRTVEFQNIGERYWPDLEFIGIAPIGTDDFFLIKDMFGGVIVKDLFSFNLK